MLNSSAAYYRRFFIGIGYNLESPLDKNAIVKRQVNSAVRQLDRLATLPSVLASILAALDRCDSKQRIASIINLDPAMTSAFLSESGCTNNGSTLESVITLLSTEQIRQIALSVPVFQQFDETDGVELEVLPYSQIVLHSLATGCAAKLIAEKCLDVSCHRNAYIAGLLHDIGKLALYQVMPKSFERVAEFALLHSHCSLQQETHNLGISHSTIGKNVAEKMNLPRLVVLAIWLHHTNTQSILDDVNTNKFVSVISLADMIARKAGVGHSGSFDQPAIEERLLDYLGLSQSQIDEISAKLIEEVGKKDEILAIDTAQAKEEFPGILQECAVKLASENSQLQEKNVKLASASMQSDSIQQFINDLPLSPLYPEQIAFSAIQTWLSHFNASAAAMYYYLDGNQRLEVVSLDDSSNASSKILSVSVADGPVIPEAIQGSFDIVDAEDAWIVSHVDCLKDSRTCYILPLIADGNAIGAIVYQQLSSDVSLELQKELYEVPAGVIAAILTRAISCLSSAGYAERFATLLSDNQAEEKIRDSVDPLSVIAEMAAGAAHELNNPLAVISGRTQLMADSESDPDRKRDLEQIRKRTEDASRIVTQLMTYAKPEQPARIEAGVMDIVKGACDLVFVAKQIDEPDVVYDGIDELEPVNVDGNHMIAAITAIVANALESYDEGFGKVEITAKCPQKSGMAGFLVKDSGRGMDAETVAKATTPFFSLMPAGRKRGMGLANAHRLIALNGGLLKITSLPGKGTTVRIDLPLA